MYYVYILKSQKNQSLYIGFTKDLRKRFFEHNKGLSEYTSKYTPWIIVYYEAYSTYADAQNREKQLKHHAKAWGQLKGRIRNSLIN